MLNGGARYRAEGRIRRDGSFRTLREVRAYAVSLAARPLSRWMAVPSYLTEHELLAFLRRIRNAGEHLAASFSGLPAQLEYCDIPRGETGPGEP